jgi:hypothetical protein
MRLSRFIGSLVLLLIASGAYAQTPFRILDNGSLEPLYYKLNLIGSSISCAGNSGARRIDCTLNALAAVTADSPLAGAGTAASHLTCASCLTGTGVAAGDLFYSTSGGNALSRIAAVASGSILASAGTNTPPTYVSSLSNFTLVSPLVSTATSPVDTAIVNRSQADTHGVTITPQFTLENTTAATSGNQKISGAVDLCGQGWKTTATAGSQQICGGMYALPVQGTTNPNAAIAWYLRTNGGARTARMSMYWPNTGTITFLTSGTPSEGTSGGAVGFDSSGELKLYGGSGSTNHLRFTNNAIFPSATNGISLGGTAFAWAGVYAHEFEVVTLGPTTCAIDTGAGTGATCSVQTFSPLGTGAIDVTTAGTPAGSDATVVTVTGGAGNGFTSKGHCIIGARDSTTALAMQSLAIYSVSSGTGSGSSTFLIKNAHATGLTTATTYKFTWICIGGN